MAAEPPAEAQQDDAEEPQDADPLIQACLAAPSHGLNAKALILQVALAGDDEEDGEEGEEGQQEGGQPGSKRRRIAADPQAEAAAAAARRGAEYLAAVPAVQRPLVPYLARSKIPRIHRQTVLSKLAGEHLALAAHWHQPAALDPQAAAADEALRKVAWEAALAQELDLYKRCSSQVVYQNIAARTSALQWQQPAQQQQEQGQQEQTQQGQAQQKAQQAQQQAQQQTQQGQQPAVARAGRNGKAGGQGQQREQPFKHRAAAGAAAGDGAAATPPAASLKPPDGPSSEAVPAGAKQVEETELDWEAAQPDSLSKLAQAGQGADADAAAAAASATELAAGLAAGAATLLGAGSFQPLRPLAAVKSTADGPSGSGRPAAAERPAQQPPAGAAPNVVQQAGAAASSIQQADAGQGTVQAQVELFVRAELHPLLKRRQISQALHDSVACRCVSKVLQRHPGATSADFLVPEAAAIRSLVKQYLQHVQGQGQQ